MSLFVYAPGQDAANINYDNTVSGLTATQVQAAIDELAAGGGGITWSTPVDANIVPDSNNTRSLGTSGTGFSSLYVNAVYDLDGGQVMDFTTGVVFQSNEGDLTFNSNATGKVVFGSEDLQIFSQLGGAPHIRFYKAGAGNYTQIGISNSISTNTSFVLPGADGTAGQVLQTDGAGNLSFVTPASSGANTSLSNLSSVSINTDLIPDGGGLELGQSGSNFWLGLYVINIYDADGSLSYHTGERRIYNGPIPILDAASNALIKVLGDNTASGGIQLNRFANDFSVILKAPDSLAADLQLSLPLADGSDKHAIITDGAGNLSFASVWTIPVDSMVTPDADNTRQLGDLSNAFADAYINKVQDSSGDKVLSFVSGIELNSASGDIGINSNDTGVINIGANRFRLFASVGAVAPILEFREIGGAEYIGLRCPDSVSGSTTFTLPGADGSAGQTLVTDGSGAWSFTNRSIWESGATGSRPGSPVTAQTYFDTTLGIPIWFDGSNWIDATGTTV